MPELLQMATNSRGTKQLSTATAPLDSHQNTSDQHQQCGRNEHHCVHSESVLGLIAFTHVELNSS